MPRKALRPCPRCRRNLTRERFCDKCGGNTGWHTTSRHERGYGSDWDKTTKRIRQRDHHLCQECLREGVVNDVSGNHRGQVDHIIPKEQGGTDDDDNLELLCNDHHKIKTQREALRGKRGLIT